jgi:Tfp pilus assembly protein PilF
MEVRWRQRQWAGYARDAQAALARASVAQQDPTFCKAVLDLLRTYVESPRPEEMPAAVDEAIARLAIGMYHRLHFMGHWQQMAYLWRHLAAFARQLPDATFFAELIKQQALIVSSLGRTQESQRLYQTLVQDAAFARLPIRMQADMLVNVGTSALWTGDLRRAERLLHQTLALTEPDTSTARQPFDSNSVLNIATFAAQLWESRAYAFNQLGCLAMFRGQFDQAERYYRSCLAIFLQQGEAENLACVAYQALGRLWLYAGRTAEAIPILEQGLAIRRRWLEQEGIATNEVYLGAAYLATGNLRRAEASLQEALRVAQTVQSATIQILAHLYFGQLALCRLQPAATAIHWQQALALLRTTDLPLIEQRVLLGYLPWLWRHQWRLAWQATRQLAYSAWRQRLGPQVLWRLTHYARRTLQANRQV